MKLWIILSIHTQKHILIKAELYESITIDPLIKKACWCVQWLIVDQNTDNNLR